MCVWERKREICSIFVLKLFLYFIIDVTREKGERESVSDLKCLQANIICLWLAINVHLNVHQQLRSICTTSEFSLTYIYVHSILHSVMISILNLSWKSTQNQQFQLELIVIPVAMKALNCINNFFSLLLLLFFKSSKLWLLLTDLWSEC